MFGISIVRYFRHLYSLNSYLRLVVSLSFGMLGIFMMGSLITFDPFDPTFCYITTHVQEYTNVFGYYGAQCAGILYFLLGGASLLFVFLSFIFAYSIMTLKKMTIDQYCGWLLLVPGIATYCSLNGVDIVAHIQPGGLLGISLISRLSKIADPIVIELLCICVVIASLLLITSCSIVTLGHYFLRLSMYSYSLLRPFLVVCFMQIKQLLSALVTWLWSVILLLFGKEIEDEVGVLSFDELTQRALQDSPNDEDFWQELLSEEPVQLTIDNPVPQQVKAVPEKRPACVVKKSLYRLPTVALLQKTPSATSTETEPDLKVLATVLEEKLERFGIKGSVTAIKKGPVITMFEYAPHIDSKISKIIALEDDLALALQAMSIRIIAPIPGRSVIGFEVANKVRRSVHSSSSLASKTFKSDNASIPLLIGEDVVGNTFIMDLAKAPHLLVAGSTGSGKSVALNTMLISLLFKFKPDELKLILIDPKRLEFASYADIPHLLFPIITDPKKASGILHWVVKTMEERYELMQKYNVRNVFDYHEYARRDATMEAMPFLVVIIDELSDLMMTAGKDVEDLIVRIAQMARAAGIHMIVATQRPSVDVITGLIKVNFPSRISFKVTSKVDSRTILDCIGADKLLGKGDMLYLDTQASLHRVHGAYITNQDIESVVSYIKQQQEPNYIDLQEAFAAGASSVHDPDDELLAEVIAFLDTIDDVSISLLQRKFRIGYNFDLLQRKI